MIPLFSKGIIRSQVGMKCFLSDATNGHFKCGMLQPWASLIPVCACAGCKKPHLGLSKWQLHCTEPDSQLL